MVKLFLLHLTSRVSSIKFHFIYSSLSLTHTHTLCLSIYLSIYIASYLSLSLSVSFLSLFLCLSLSVSLYFSRSLFFLCHSHFLSQSSPYSFYSLSSQYPLIILSQIGLMWTSHWLMSEVFDKIPDVLKVTQGESPAWSTFNSQLASTSDELLHGIKKNSWNLWNCRQTSFLHGFPPRLDRSFILMERGACQHHKSYIDPWRKKFSFKVKILVPLWAPNL